MSGNLTSPFCSLMSISMFLIIIFSTTVLTFDMGQLDDRLLIRLLDNRDVFVHFQFDTLSSMTFPTGKIHIYILTYRFSIILHRIPVINLSVRLSTCNMTFYMQFLTFGCCFNDDSRSFVCQHKLVDQLREIIISIAY